ncbi:MAG: FAD binding domain-containing protein [Alphaproteobacteria bacterium]|nr:FAD binding domain-containing protein [Alphaproteobacteria bacterium]
MKPAPFDYLRAASLDEALAALSRGGEEARVLAGGQSLIAMLNLRLVEPAILIDISHLEALAYIREDGGMLEVGAATTQAELARWPELAAKVPLLAKLLPHVGHTQTRGRGTVCGSIAHADPSSELPLCLALLAGEVVLRSEGGMRRLPAGDFQTGMLTTARAADEIVSAVRFPLARADAGYAFTEMTRRHGDFAIVAIAAEVTGDGSRIAIGGVADRPAVRVLPDGNDLDVALNAVAWDLGAADDIHATARYRRELVRRLGRRTIEEARTCRP